MKRVKFNLCMCFLFAVYVVLVIVSNVRYESVSVMAESGSYAETFASEHHLVQREITDDVRADLDVRYTDEDVENVKTNLTDEKGAYIEISKDDVTIRVYDDGTITNGSEELTIADQTVTTTMITTTQTVTDEIYLVQAGDTLSSISAEQGVGIYEIAQANHIENINLIYAGVELKIPTKQQITEITTVTTAITQKAEETTESVEEFQYVVSPMSECEFGYKVVDDAVELLYYYGNEKELIIPSYIADYPVTTVAFDLVGNFDLVVIPQTVTAITGKVARLLYTPLFFAEILFSMVAYLVVMIAINVVLPRFQNRKEIALSGTQLLFSIIYLVGQLTFSILTIYHYIEVNLFTALVISALLLCAYLFIMFLAGSGRSHAIAEEKESVQATAFMKQLKMESADFADGISDMETKKEVQRLVDDIRFSGLESTDEMAEVNHALKEAVDELKKAIADGDKEQILIACQRARELLGKRNRM